MAEAKPKPKLNKKAVEMAKQEPKVRAKNFSEVALGYNEAEALRRSKSMSAMSKSSMQNWVSSGGSYSTIHKMHSRKEYAEGIATIKIEKCVASCLWTCLPSRSTMPKLNVSLAKWVTHSASDA